MSKTIRRRGVVVDLARQRSPEPTVSISGHRLGWFAGGDVGHVQVDYPDNVHGPLEARVLRSVDAELLRRSIAGRAEVLLVFEGERADRPIVVGLLANERPAAEPEANALPCPDEAMVDGRRVVLDAREEIVLRCGHASITLRRNGRVVIRGTYVETHSRGVNRIKGGAVQIN